VIAKATFSRWAAWLGEEASSIVYAPKPWCAWDLSLNPVPERWRLVDDATQGP
jgi:hypothetical protein